MRALIRRRLVHLSCNDRSETLLFSRKKPWTSVVSGRDSWKGSNLNQSPALLPPRRSRCVVGVSSDDQCRYFPFAGWIVNGDGRRWLMHPLCCQEEKSFTLLSQSIKLMRRRKLGSADATRRRWRPDEICGRCSLKRKARGLCEHPELQPAKSVF